MNATRRTMNVTRLIATGAMLLPMIAACGASDVVSPAYACSTAGLNGSYGMQRNGQTAPGTVTTSVGLVVFDGKGNYSVQQTVSVNGTPTTLPPASGSYVVNSDCTGSESDASGKVISTLAVVHGGDEVLGISVVPGSSMTVHFERVTGACSNATITGDYAFQRNGQAGGGIALVALGTITFDGKGSQFVGQTIDRGGTITTVSNLVGTYTINADCSGTQFDPGLGKVISSIIVVHGGDQILGMSTTQGNNVVLHYERLK